MEKVIKTETKNLESCPVCGDDEFRLGDKGCTYPDYDCVEYNYICPGCGSTRREVFELKQLEVLELGKGIVFDVKIPFEILATTEDIALYGGEENLKALVMDIMERYANASYFDVVGLIEKGVIKGFEKDENIYPAGCDRNDCCHYQIREKFGGKCQECLENCHIKVAIGTDNFEKKGE